jgi:pimeloyl-ACP methyl ester carboxylesterase
VELVAGGGLRIVRVLAAACALGLGLSACGSQSAARTPPPTLHHAVGLATETLVDPSRATPANGAVSAHPGRTVGVTIYYPSEGSPKSRPIRDQPVDRSAAPYPLIVFAPGFGATPAGYQALLVQWASAGYVVAGLTFPLTSADVPGGADLADYTNQPGDMSFAVSQLLAQSQASSEFLRGVIDPNAVGAAGHSLGGVTTLGLVANTCCFDQRIRAAVVMSGDVMVFPGGQTRYPPIPLLFVHGNADPVVPYAASVSAFNAANAPKALLTIERGGHGSPVDPTGAAFASVVRTTTNFFDLYLKHEQSAAAQMRSNAQPNTTTLALALHPGASIRLPVPRSSTRRLRATVDPSSGLVDGQQLVVSWEGYAPGVTVNVLQCTPPLTGAQACDLSTADVGVADPGGAGTTFFTVHTGQIGAGTCDATHSQCAIVVNQGGSSSPSDSVIVAITFKG